jgi:hypothetical protein
MGSDSIGTLIARYYLPRVLVPGEVAAPYTQQPLIDTNIVPDGHLTAPAATASTAEG